MMLAVLSRLIVVLSVLAFAAGMTIQAIPSARALGLSGVAGNLKADPEFPRMAMEPPDESAPAPLPCKGIVLDCVKQMGCVGTPALPDRSGVLGVPIAYYAIVSYWSPSPSLAGQDVEPDLFPPIAG
jgi:hypothetical protein